MKLKQCLFTTQIIFMLIALTMTIIFAYLLALLSGQAECLFKPADVSADDVVPAANPYIVNTRFLSILLVGFLTYLLDFIVRGIILFGI